MTIARWLETIAGFFALAAAVFWLLSASPWESLPQMVTYFDATPESDPFRQAMICAARMNGDAALCSFFGALLAAARLFIGEWGKVRPGAS